MRPSTFALLVCFVLLGMMLLWFSLTYVAVIIGKKYLRLAT
jgi:hypothetical protein